MRKDKIDNQNHRHHNSDKKENDEDEHHHRRHHRHHKNEKDDHKPRREKRGDRHSNNTDSTDSTSNSTTTTTTTVMINNDTELFFRVLRNNFLRNQIRYKLFENIVVNIDSSELNNTCNIYLSTLSTLDKINNNITIRITFREQDQFAQYVNSQFKHIVNDIVFEKEFNVTSKGNTVFDFSKIHKDVKSLSFFVDGRTGFDKNDVGKLPSNLINLEIKSETPNPRDQGITVVIPEFSNPTLDAFLSNLPSHCTRIKTLALPKNYNILLDQLVLPSTLSYLEYLTKDNSNLRKLVVPSSKDPFTCSIVCVRNENDLKFVDKQKWLPSLDIMAPELKRGVVPFHIKNLEIFHSRSIQEGSLPNSLESLSLCGTTNDLDLYKNMFPSNLKRLFINLLDRGLKKDVFPASLQSLRIFKCSDLRAGFLPTSLVRLELTNYNGKLVQGLLPPSLTVLSIRFFNGTLEPNVLPQGLKKLNLFEFNQQLVANALPSSITNLYLQSYNKTFQFSTTLPNLKDISVNTLNRSIINLIDPNNCSRLKITFSKLDPFVTFQNTSILRLYLSEIGHQRSAIYAGLLPNSLIKLKMRGMVIKDRGVIPDSVIYIQTANTITDILKPNLIPKTVKYLTDFQRDFAYNFNPYA